MLAADTQCESPRTITHRGVLVASLDEDGIEVYGMLAAELGWSHPARDIYLDALGR
jgi:hypothetical protein